MPEPKWVTDILHQHDPSDYSGPQDYAADCMLLAYRKALEWAAEACDDYEEDAAGDYNSTHSAYDDGRCDAANACCDTIRAKIKELEDAP